MDEILNCDGSHAAIAKIAQNAFSDTCVPISRDLWYVFNGTLWERHWSEAHVMIGLSTTIRYKFEAAISLLKSQLTIDDYHENTPKLKEINKKCKDMEKIVLRLQNRNHTVKCKSEIVKLMKNPDFVNKLDSKQHIIAFKNGQWD